MLVDYHLDTDVIVFFFFPSCEFLSILIVQQQETRDKKKIMEFYSYIKLN